VAILVVLLIPIIGIGIYPSLLFAPMQTSVADVVQNTLAVPLLGSQ
jgi:NADH:ubiquinone oxidoreductase subunit 4 (subunit M)